MEVHFRKANYNGKFDTSKLHNIYLNSYDISQHELVRIKLSKGWHNETQHKLKLEIVFQNEDTTLENISNFLKQIQELCVNNSKNISDL